MVEKGLKTPTFSINGWPKFPQEAGNCQEIGNKHAMAVQTLGSEFLQKKFSISLVSLLSTSLFLP